MRDQSKTKQQLIDELNEARREAARWRREVEDLHSHGAGRYRSVVDNVVDGVITIDEHGLIESFNPAAETIFGYRADEVVGRSVDLLMPERYARHHGGYLQRYLRTGQRHIIGIGREVEGHRKDGTVLALDLAVSEFRLGERRMFTGIARDITERKQLEVQLLQAQKMESIGQLAGGIAHDFNNQLSIILFDVDLLLAGSAQYPALQEDLLKIRKVVLRGANLARQLLVFSRRQQLEPRPTHLNDLVQELRRMLGRLLGEQIRVDLSLAEDLWRVNVDPSNIDQVILNLAINSRDAMPQGGGLTFRTRNVVLDEEHARPSSQARPGSFVVLEVADTGVGMDEDVQLRIFEPFFTTKEEGKGTGLGLSVVYGIVRAHRGWIEVESQPGQGCTFRIFVPALESVVVEPDARPVSAAAERGGRGERILLVEDEPELRERTARALQRHGYRVRACATVAEGSAAFVSADGPFDLVVSDVVLPDGRGPELVLQLLAARPGLAALLTTGYVDHEALDIERVQREHIPILQKPFTVEQLLAQVRHALGHG